LVPAVTALLAHYHGILTQLLSPLDPELLEGRGTRAYVQKTRWTPGALVVKSRCNVEPEKETRMSLRCVESRKEVVQSGPVA
jgi:hypothetical protein